MSIELYIKEVKKRFSSGISTEHSYRADLQNLLLSLVQNIIVTNEPKRQKCGAPDYIIQKKEVPIGYIEAKDIGTCLNKVEKSDQLKRYLISLDNLILTDYLEFRFYKHGEKVYTIQLAKIENGKVQVLKENFEPFSNRINDFCAFIGTTIKSSEKLAKMMANKARMMEEVIFNAIREEDEDNSLKEQYETFKKILIHDLKEKDFADIYAQTIAYGMFAARLHDDTLEDFSRQEAVTLIPKSNPFLRQLFKYVSDPDLDVRIDWIINDLADIFRATDLNELLADFGKSTEQTDPFIHFYETFLAEYDPKLRKSRGVYYTPAPVVNFIVRAIDDILKTEFGISAGLADTSKVEIEVEKQGTNKKIKESVHKVQILDPATGTGTFLYEVVKHIHKRFTGQQGIWSKYVENDLIPRINGFEILMASYTMCHLKLEMLLRETGYKPQDENKQPRLRVFLTNSLEEAHPDTGTLFASWLSKEASDANFIKRDTPVMVVLGNPPYANFGQMNQGEWIRGLLQDYKKDLNEKKINLDDDYIKFIRYGQYYIDKNGEGILAYISNNSFIDGITHRQMRKSLLESFDKVYILDLHGNAKKREVAPDGGKDENVFDIMQGVSINIFIKIQSSKHKNEVLFYETFGERELKYNFLNTNSINSLKWDKLYTKEPYYFFTKKDFSKEDQYKKGFKIDELFIQKSTGIETQRDSASIHFSKKELNLTLDILKNYEVEEIRNKLNLGKDGRDWSIINAKKDILNDYIITEIHFKPFDFRFIPYTGNSKGIIAYPRHEINKHVLESNFCLISPRFFKETPSYFITNKIIGHKVLSAYDKNLIFPIYLYQNDKSNLITDGNVFSNLNISIIKEIENILNINFTVSCSDSKNTFDSLNILDYIYAVLHSPKYRETYKEFLKIDFPRVPYPKDAEYFWKMVEFGSQLREIHLLESPKVEEYITTYPVDGNNIVEKIHFDSAQCPASFGKVYINRDQYFGGVPKVAWEFYIGGYQPAQKWLKDRKGRELSYDDILHYQKIIVALKETSLLMEKIDTVMEII